jgi:hypothetical protein
VIFSSHKLSDKANACVASIPEQWQTENPAPRNRGRCQTSNATMAEIGIGKVSLGRLNVVSFRGYGVRTEAQRWQVILHFVSGSFYTGC